MMQSKNSFLSDIQPLHPIFSNFILHFSWKNNLPWLLKRQSLPAGREATSSFSQRRYFGSSCTIYNMLAVKVINYFSLSLILLCNVLHVHLITFTSLWYEVKHCSSICVPCFPFLGYTNCFPLLFMNLICYISKLFQLTFMFCLNETFLRCSR